MSERKDMYAKKTKKTNYVSLDDFLKKTTPCKNGFRCQTPGCKFMHNMKTRLCKFGDRCRRRADCTFAHSKDELYTPECRFGLRCKNEKCPFKHPSKAVFPDKPKAAVSVNNENNLQISNFPETITPEINETNIDYTQMRDKIKFVQKITVEGELEKMLEKYEDIENFEEITFRL